MEPADRDFYIALGLWGASAVTVLGTGLFGVVEGYYTSGVPLSFLGLGLVAYMAQHLKGKRLTAQHALIGTLILTWLFFGYDVYDRHYGHSAPPPPDRWKEAYGPQSGSIGPVMAVELVQFLNQLPKPCFVTITAPKEDLEFKDTFSKLLSYSACRPGPFKDNARTDAGIDVHWDKSYAADRFFYFLRDSGLRVKEEHHMTEGNLIWLDFGPGSPW